MLWTIPRWLPWHTQGILGAVLSWCHLIGAVSPWIGSFIYHVFMNVNYDEAFYRSLLRLDMIGIWLCQSFGNSCHVRRHQISNQLILSFFSQLIKKVTNIRFFFVFYFRSYSDAGSVGSLFA